VQRSDGGEQEEASWNGKKHQTFSIKRTASPATHIAADSRTLLIHCSSAHLCLQGVWMNRD
jgi:hypothetical protein